jgi:glycosyltransferase involved in cell wall biosynthesis
MSVTKPSVSVVISNYNYAEFLPQAIESVQAQTHAPVEIIVVDDGSTDDSRVVLERYPVHVIHQKNQGQASALDAGVSAASGEIICLLDADDVWLPHKIERVVAAFNYGSDVSWVRHQLELVTADLRPTGALAPAIKRSARMPRSAAHVAERAITVSTSALAFRASVRAVFPLHDGANFRFDADALLVARLGAHYDGWQIAEVLGYYRRHDRQQFTGTADMERMLERQIAVGSMVARALGRSEPVSNFKHRTVLAAMRRQSRWRELAGGLAAGAGLATTPALMARQVSGLLYAGVAPAAWLRRLNRSLGSIWCDSHP